MSLKKFPPDTDFDDFVNTARKQAKNALWIGILWCLAIGVINLGLLAGAVWVVVWVLRSTGIIS